MLVTEKHMNISLSPVDTARFGVRTARVSGVGEANLPYILQYCRGNEVEFLVARTAVTDLHAAQAMEREGFLLMDTLVYYGRKLDGAPIPEDIGEAHVRVIDAGDEEGVREVAAQAFRGYFGHYHADRRLDPAKCDEGYIEWAVRSCVSKEVADGVLVAEINGSVVGFITLRMNSPAEFDGLLIAVHPSMQGRGIARSLMIGALKWCESRGAERMIISTQINNLSSQKVWARLGFELSHAYYTFHKWFDWNQGVTSHAD